MAFYAEYHTPLLRPEGCLAWHRIELWPPHFELCCIPYNQALALSSHSFFISHGERLSVEPYARLLKVTEPARLAYRKFLIYLCYPNYTECYISPPWLAQLCNLPREGWKTVVRGFISNKHTLLIVTVCFMWIDLCEIFNLVSCHFLMCVLALIASQILSDMGLWNGSSSHWLWTSIVCVHVYSKERNVLDISGLSCKTC